MRKTWVEGGKDVICIPDSFSSGLDRETVTKEMDMRMPSAVICRRGGAHR